MFFQALVRAIGEIGTDNPWSPNQIQLTLHLNYSQTCNFYACEKTLWLNGNYFEIIILLKWNPSMVVTKQHNFEGRPAG